MRAALLIAVAMSLSCAHATPRTTQAGATPRQPIERFIRARCATDGRDVFVSWSGTVEAELGDGSRRHLFDVIGMSATRCGRDDHGGWYLTSRELMLYLDPATGAPLQRWHNPWTGAEVTVVHVANDPVQSRLPTEIPAVIDGEQTRFVVDVPLRYPNPLAADPRLRRYSPEADYVAHERFELSSPTAALASATSASMTLTWDREGPWLPWMEMGSRPGRLIYRSRGEKLSDWSKLPALLRREVDDRLPVYRHAPRCLTDHRNVTSWTYFAAHVDDYLSGARFPVPEPPSDSRCAGATPSRGDRGPAARSDSGGADPTPDRQ